MLTRIPDWVTSNAVDRANNGNLDEIIAANAVAITAVDTAFAAADAHVVALTTLDGLAAGATAGQITTLLTVATAIKTAVSDTSVAISDTKTAINAQRAAIV